MATWLEKVKEAGYEIWALTPSVGSENLHTIKIPKYAKVALMLGTEATGLTDGGSDSVDRHVQIPMSGTVDSLNVGAAAAIAFYAVQAARV